MNHPNNTQANNTQPDAAQLAPLTISRDDLSYDPTKELVTITEEDNVFSVEAGRAYMVGGVPMLCMWSRVESLMAGLRCTIDHWRSGGTDAFVSQHTDRRAGMPELPEVIQVLMSSTQGSVQLKLTPGRLGDRAGFIPLMPVLEQMELPSPAGLRVGETPN